MSPKRKADTPPPAPTPTWVHYADPVRVIDGDTIVVRLDLGRYPHPIETSPPIRIAGLWCPEMHEPNGREARVLMASLCGLGRLTVQTLKPNPRDPYGRVVANVWAGQVSLPEAVIKEGLGFATLPELQAYLGEQERAAAEEAEAVRLRELTT